MAGHLALKKEDEPKLFVLVNKLRKVIASNLSTAKDFDKFKIIARSKSYEIMKLSSDYVDNPKSERAFTIGKVSVESITDEHPSITQNISVEVHLIVGLATVKVKDIFWVA